MADEEFKTYERPEMPFERKADPGYRGGGMIAAGFQFAIVVALFFFGGRWLDGKAGTEPWLTIVFTMLGVAAATAILIREVLRISGGKGRSRAGSRNGVSANDSRRWSPARFLVVTTFVLLGLGLLLGWPAWAWNGMDGVRALGVAMAITWVGAFAARLATEAVRRRIDGPQGSVHALMAGLSARLFLSLGLALVVVVMEPFALVPFAVWILVGYLSVLGLEVLAVMREFGQNPGPRAEDGSEDVTDSATTSGGSRSEAEGVDPVSAVRRTRRTGPAH